MRSRYTAALFNNSIRHVSLECKIIQKDYFFVDTNVIIGFRKKEYPGLEDFIKCPYHQFFYTETVLEELEAGYSDYPEASPANNSDSYFKFIDSQIAPNRKKNALDMLDEIWQKEFAKEKNKIEKGFGLSHEQLQRFKNDLFIIFEAGATCHRIGVLPDDDLRTPPLLTNNMHLLKKFLLRQRAHHVLETTINLSGLEHLIPVLYLQESIKEWLKMSGTFKANMIPGP